MNVLEIFGVQLALSLVVYALITKWYVSPWLSNKPINAALMFLIFPHAFRHLGLAFLLPGLVDDSLPESFANAAAYGDFVTGLLAILALFSLRAEWRLAIPIVWLFNVFGAADLVNALRNAEAVPYLGVTWFIPTFVVPVLLVTHLMIFARLIGREHQVINSPAQSGP
jgi:hypothetical protein